MMLKFLIEFFTTVALVAYFQLKIDEFSKELHRLHYVIEQIDTTENLEHRRVLSFHSPETTKEVEILTLDLEECMILSCISYAYMIKHLTGFIYSRLTSRNF